MRIRTIKPEFWKHDRVAEMTYSARLLFIALWGMADRRGRLEDRPRRIKAECFPYDDCDVEAVLHEIESFGFIDRYEAEGVRVIQVVSFEKHQRISGKEAEAESKLPAKQLVTDGEANEKHPGAQERKGKEGKGREKEEERSSSRAREQASIPCLEFSPTDEHAGICAFRNASLEHQLARFRALNPTATDTPQGWEARFRHFLARARPEVEQSPISPPAPRQEAKRPSWVIDRDLNDARKDLQRQQEARREARDQRNRFSVGQAEYRKYSGQMADADERIRDVEEKIKALSAERGAANG